MLAVAIGLVVRTLLWPREVCTEALGFEPRSAAAVAAAAALCLSPFLWLALELPFLPRAAVVLASPLVFVALSVALGALLFALSRALEAEPSFGEAMGLAAQLLVPLWLPWCLFMMLRSTGLLLAVPLCAGAAAWALWVCYVLLVDGAGASSSRVLALYVLLLGAAAVGGIWRAAVWRAERQAQALLAEQLEQAELRRRERARPRPPPKPELVPLAAERAWSVSVVSVPPGADIVGPKGPLGAAPRLLTFRGEGPVTLRLTRGELTRTLEVSPGDDGQTVVLAVGEAEKLEPPPKSPAREPAKKPAKKPAPKRRR